MPDKLDAFDQSVLKPRDTRIQDTLQYASIAEYSGQRRYVAESVAEVVGAPNVSPERILSVVTQEARDVNLGLLNRVIGLIWERDDLNPKTKETFDQITKMYAEGRDPSQNMLIQEEIDNPTFDKSNLLPEIILLTILKDPELSPILMQEIDKIVKDRSDGLLQEIDELAERGETKKFTLGIVGGGPLTSLALSAVGPLFDNIVITADDRLGEPWRSRLLIFINSAVKGDGGENAPLPILEGGTTPIVARYLQQAIRLGYLLDDTDLKVLCKDGEIEEGRINQFIAGEKLGNATALNIFAYADTALVGQKVLPDETVILGNGNKILTIEDVKTGKRRRIEIETAAFLTGPGQEYLPLDDERSNRDYASAKIQVDDYIQNVQRQIAEGLPVVLPTLPRILTLTSMEKLFRLWTVDLKRNPRLYPFASMFGKNKKVAFAGGGDTAKCENEFVILTSPDGAYPPNFKKTAKNFIPSRTGYRFPKPSKVRVRYRDAARMTKRVNRKISGFANEGKKVVVTDESGEKKVFDYLFVGLGFKRFAIEDSLTRNGIKISKVADLEGETVALGNELLGILIGGSATGFREPDFPDRIRNIIRINGISENTISLWVNAILTERLCYKVATLTTVNREKVNRLYSTGALMPVANRMVGGLIFEKINSQSSISI